MDPVQGPTAVFPPGPAHNAPRHLSYEAQLHLKEANTWDIPPTLFPSEQNINKSVSWECWISTKAKPPRKLKWREHCFEDEM